MIIHNLLIEKYNQKGEGVGFYNNKPVYVFGTIINEIIDCLVKEEKKKYYIGSVKSFIKKSQNRVEHNQKDSHLIGGYELLHMNDYEQKKFKIQKVINDFKQIAKIELNDIDYFQGNKRFYYRNKIVLHDGGFFQKQTHKSIKIGNYLLSDIPYNPNLKGEIIYRKLDTLIYGTKKENKYTTDSMFGKVFRIGLNSFYQINKEIALVVYQDILDNVIKNGNTLDLYAGIATITIIVSNKSNHVIGVEINHDSFNDALFNIKNNNIDNIDFYCDDVDKWINNNKQIKIDTLILDPSRNGVSTKTILNILNYLKPKRIIYLSCNPGTQASNIFWLKDQYTIIKAKVYDMFPQTYHIESLIVLDRKNNI